MYQIFIQGLIREFKKQSWNIHIQGITQILYSGKYRVRNLLSWKIRSGKTRNPRQKRVSSESIFCPIYHWIALVNWTTTSSTSTKHFSRFGNAIVMCPDLKINWSWWSRLNSGLKILRSPHPWSSEALQKAEFFHFHIFSKFETHFILFNISRQNCFAKFSQKCDETNKTPKTFWGQNVCFGAKKICL
jgi:hypothetical protein